ncbi:hypothetical protein QF032_004146 [Streptomyces achromogenes]|uniref:Secreted protein n=1 Tax=Streptomyces achromogenes TaxID=67255 RepID=A0ABU0Q386_STRAH|nr:hypothetical protein [Streptomyces achromogenes]MDQ0832302.1 hypothetical protein [Streptomyces achromogenes]
MKPGNAVRRTSAALAVGAMSPGIVTVTGGAAPRPTTSCPATPTAVTSARTPADTHSLRRRPWGGGRNGDGRAGNVTARESNICFREMRNGRSARGTFLGPRTARSY